MVTAFDADVLIYATSPGHELGKRVLGLFPDAHDEKLVGVGSTLLVPELLIKPTRAGNDDEVAHLVRLLSRIQLLGLERDIANMAARLGARVGLKAPDAIHLATAIYAGADQFLTNNSRDFPQTFEDIDIIYPSDLPDPDEDDGPAADRIESDL